MQPALHVDEMHVVSDLHLGGFDDRKIFTSHEELVGLLQHAEAQARSRPVAFVVNGDFVDFLSARQACYFDPPGAARKLQETAKDGDFEGVFQALREFASADQARLVINIGNHDLELALPWVREALLDVLADKSAPARGRIFVETGGTGVLIQVGAARVLCVHGNEADAWNAADYERIRKIARDTNQGSEVDRWIPNAGTQLVIDVMNEIKRGRYPFVDLLKPEDDAVVPALLALDPSLLSKIPLLAPIGARGVRDWLRTAAGLLGDDASGTNVEPPDPEPILRPDASARRDLRARILLESTERRLGAGEVPRDLLQADGESLQLGFGGILEALRARAETNDACEALRRALRRGIAGDRSFEPAERDHTCRYFDEAVSSDVDVIVAGHTHLERACPRKRGSGHYFNTGTWARLIQLQPDVLVDRTHFKPCFDAFAAGTMKALDDAPNLVQRKPTVVSVWKENGATCAELCHVKNATGNVTFDPVLKNGRGRYEKR